MSSLLQLSAQTIAIQQQFSALLSAEVIDTAAATGLLQQLEQNLLLLAKQAKPTTEPTAELPTDTSAKLSSEKSSEIASYLQNQLSWLAEQVEQLNAEKTLISAQLIQITRARKGNASYDEHKSG